MPDRDAAPAAAEGAPDAAFEAWLAESANFAATSLLGLTLRPTFDAGWDAAVEAARPAPAVAPREGTADCTCSVAWCKHPGCGRPDDEQGYHAELAAFGFDVETTCTTCRERTAAREAARGEGDSDG